MSPFVKEGNKINITAKPKRQTSSFHTFEPSHFSTFTPSPIFESAAAYLILLLTFFLCFKDWFSHFSSEIFLSLDSTVLYYPVYQWVHSHLVQDKLPLICDLAYHGAPVAAVSMAGVLSPVLWLFHLASSPVIMTNLIFLTPFLVFLFGTYVLGRQLGFSVSACLLLAFLWTYNGQRMAQLDHWNVAWACAFFPWAFWSLLRYGTGRSFFWLMLAGLFWGLNLLSGHPQIFFLEGLFFLSWALLADNSPRPLGEGDRDDVNPGLINTTLTLSLSRLSSGALAKPDQGRGEMKKRLIAVSGLGLGALIVASPLILFVGENLSMDGFHFQWGQVDRFFHSWTPLNFLTLVFPWFFGRDQFDRQDSDYWWQYQFVEMQTAFSIVGLFFILLFFFQKNKQKRWIAVTGLFGLAMAMGKFFFLYGWIQSLPVFSWFRDPARYWHLITWVAGLGAAYAWDEWFHPLPSPALPLPLVRHSLGEVGSRERGIKNKKSSALEKNRRLAVSLSNRAGENAVDEKLFQKGRKLALGLALSALTLILTGWALLTFVRPLIESTAAWMIRHFLLGDSLHQQPLAAYLVRLPEKLTYLNFSLDLRNSMVYIPLLFLGKLLLVIWNRKNWNLDLQKGLLLALIFADLMIFRMPLGDVFYKPSDIPAPAYAAPENRSLVMLYQNISPLPPQYGVMAYPNMNLVSGRPNLVIDANPALPGYDKILKDLGWFSWVYKDRDPVGFSKNVGLLRKLGIDQIVSDMPLTLSGPFKTVQDHYPFVYSLSGCLPKAFVGVPYGNGKLLNFNPPESKTTTMDWKETYLDLSVNGHKPALGYEPDLLFLQKTYLPGWKASLNGNPAQVKHFSEEVLTVLSLAEGANHIELKYEPLSLRVGFFLFFLFFGIFTFSFLRRLAA